MTGAAARMRHAALLIPLAACLTAGLAAAGCHRERGGTHPASEMSRSTDEGVSWQPLASGETRPLFSVAFAPARRGVAVGSHRLVLETADGGFTWTRRDLGTDRQLFLVRFAKGGGRFILGEFGILWRTDDGGANWMPVELPWDELLPALTAQFGLVEPHLYDIAFSSARGWQVREYGLILSTTDGGRTWISSEAVESSTRTSSPSRVKAKMRWSAAASAASCCSAPMAARRGLSSAATGGTCTTSSRSISTAKCSRLATAGAS